MLATTEDKFLDLARRGKNEWWRYALSGALILTFWIGGSVAAALFLIAGKLFAGNSAGGPGPNTDFMAGLDPLLVVGVLLLTFLPLLAGLLLAVRLIHGRPVTSLITPLARVDWRRAAVGFLAFGVLVALGCVAEALLYPGRYRFTFQPLETLKFLPVVLVLVPFQAAAEELLFRGYVMQGLGLLTRRAWVPVATSSLVFTVLHISNPEAQADTLLALAGYLVVAVLLALVTIQDNRLELALGMHTANNVFVLVVNNTTSALPVPPIFTVSVLDPVYGLVSMLLIGVIFYAGLALFKRSRAAGKAETV